MTTLLFRTFPVAADMAGDGRTVHGMVMPYNQTAEVSDGRGSYKEKFMPGAFARSMRERGVSKVKLMGLHDRMRMPLGRMTDAQESPDGLMAAFHLAQTPAADEALALVKDGTLDSFSVGFRPIRSSREGHVTIRHEASLHEVSLTPFPAYASATIHGVRSSAPQTLTVDTARRRLEIVLKW
ncbi:HK97 family phage prohead protease [Streptacidiphilus sp. MAP12-16]|uniref:HK97 family phage prohead protease n=1 Tax=Streptacidiphilus sp. MAP12-16 TaxID=3156300 RepID=UPI003519667C